MKNNKKRFREGSFKNRPIYIELQNYDFKHRPIEHNKDNRFIGRDSIVNKVKSFIKDSSVNSGAYLITGFRGMGKTSTVNRALSDYENKQTSGKFFVLFFVSLLLMLIDKTKLSEIIESYWYIGALFSLFVIFTLIKYTSSPNFVAFSFSSYFKSIITPSLFRARYRWIRNILTLILLVLYFAVLLAFQSSYGEIGIHQEFYLNLLFIFNSLLLRDRIRSTFNPWKAKRGSGHYILNLIYYIIITIILVVICCTASVDTTILLLLGLIAFFLMFKIISIAQNYRARSKHKDETINDESYGSDSDQKSWLSVFQRIFSFDNYIVIRINLGKDDLQENDVLKYIVNGLLVEYKKWRSGFHDVKRWLGALLPVVVTFICLNLIFYQSTLKSYTNNLMFEVQTPVYLPSQAIFVLDTSYTSHYSHLIDRLNSHDEYIETLDQIVNIDRSDLIKTEILSTLNEINSFITDTILIAGSVNSELTSNPTITKLINNRIKLLNIQDTCYLQTLSINGSLKTYAIDESNSLNNEFRTLALDRSKKPYYLDSEDEKESSEDSKYVREKLDHLNLLIHTPTQNLAIGYKSIPTHNYIRRYIAKLTNILDYYINSAYLGFRRIITYNSNPKKYHTIVPPAFDYWLILALFILFFIVRKLPIFSSFGFYLHAKAIEDIEKLKERIESSIQKEKGANLISHLQDGSSIFSFKKTNSYAILESKDIEMQIINILDKCQKIPQVLGKPKFIFVFDELDKIEIKSNRNIQSKEDENKLDNDPQFMAKRQEKISHILASLKHFLTNAQSKFIFIAGRDMYDASLAGISDRESSLDSIFHQNKLYINSFYSETSDGAIKDVGSMIEQYICKLLFSNQFGDVKSNYTLKDYYNYLDKNKGSIFDGTSENVSNKQIVKTIITLKNFIVYLTYRCNGSPKKMSSLIDEYVVSPLNHQSKENKLYVSKGSKNLHLMFTPNDQYIFSQISYLAIPLFNSTGSHKNEFGDKLLVSSSYILDHLYKHNKFAFSHRNLALTPEIVDITKEPEFRNVLDTIISHRVNNHLRRIRNGLFEYRFNSKIRNEIEMISKISERESAALNFTLDESLRLKRHFNQRLRLIRRDSKNNSESFTHSSSYIHMMIGDLHYYDQEYSDSIINYMEALQTLRYQNLNEMPLYNFVLYVRNSMKLALSLEKEYVFDSSYMQYASLTHQILLKRQYGSDTESWNVICIKRAEWPEFYEKNKSRIKKILPKLTSDPVTVGKDGHTIWENDSNDIVEHLEKISFGNNEIYVMGRVKERVNHKIIYSYSDMESFYDFDGKYIIENRNDLKFEHDPALQNFKIDTIENIRLLYQPILAKLYILEKSYTKRLTLTDIVNSLNEFKYLTRPIRDDKKQYIEADFYNKLGDLLFLKQSIFEFKYTGAPTFVYLKSIAYCLLDLKDDCKLKEILDSEITSIKKDTFSDEKIEALLTIIENCIKNRKFLEPSIMANSLSDLADHFLSEDKIKSSLKCIEQALILYEIEGNYTMIKSLNVKFIRTKILSTVCEPVFIRPGEFNFVNINIIKKYYNDSNSKTMAVDTTAADDTDFDLDIAAAVDIAAAIVTTAADDTDFDLELINRFKDAYLNYRLSYNMNFGPDSVKAHYITKENYNYISDDFDTNELFDGLSKMKIYLKDYYPFEGSTNDLDEIIVLYLISSLKSQGMNLDWIDCALLFSNQYQKSSTKLNQSQKLNLRVIALMSTISLIESINSHHHPAQRIASLTNVKAEIFNLVFPDMECDNENMLTHIRCEIIGALDEVITNNLLYGTNCTSCTYSDLIQTYRSMYAVLTDVKVDNNQTKSFTVEIEEITNSKNNYFVNKKNIDNEIESHIKERELFFRGGRTYSDFMKKGCYLEDFFNNSQLLYKLAEERYFKLKRKDHFGIILDNMYSNLDLKALR